MVFSGITFISAFLFTVFILYSVIPSIKLKNILLIVFSLVFYAVGEPVYVILMVVSSFINYLFGIFIDKSDRCKKAWLVLAVIVDLGILFVFKYADFFIGVINDVFSLKIPVTGLVMPIGISFFTFQAMSYVIDVYRNACGCQKNFFNVLLYISFFPQLIAGPIIKYHDMEQEIINRKQSVDDIEAGIRRFIIGLSKKVLISNAMAQVVDALILNISDMTFASAWVMAVGYSLQIYYDFSGYSDMAIGLGKMFGFHFKENFNYPYAAQSIKDFWRRWHISLSTWFKEYVYIPLGGNRKGRFRTFVNKYIVFFLTGFWHGANWTFMVWGLLHGTFSVIEESKHFSIERVKFKPVKYIYTGLIVICAFVIFRADNITQGIAIIARMFTFTANSAYGNSLLMAQLTPYVIFAFILGIMFAFPWHKRLFERIRAVGEGVKVENALHVVSGIALIGCLMLCMISLASDSYNPFIYFRF